MKLLRVFSFAVLCLSASKASGQTPPSLSVDNANSEGGRISIRNSSKTGATTSDWSLYNMTGPYGNGLSFWRYYADGTNVGPALWLADTGNVGIGTTSPSRKLTVQGDLLLSDGQRGSLIAHDTYSGSRSFLALDIDSQDGVASGGDYLYLAQESNRAILTSAFGTRLDLGSWVPHISILPEGNVGIGTTSPGAKLDVGGATGTQYGTVAIKQSAGGQKGIWLQAYENNNALSFYHTGSLGVITTDYTISGSHAPLALQTTGGNVGIGTTNPTHKLAVNGTVRAKEVIVDTGWADYVFADDYRLAPLSEVEAHIREKKHLPGIPSVAEVTEHGVNMGEMQAKMLAKIEELTLHQIAQEKAIRSLQRENSALHARIKQMEEHP